MLLHMIDNMNVESREWENNNEEKSWETSEQKIFKSFHPKLWLEMSQGEAGEN